jgi:hypothetical protein
MQVVAVEASDGAKMIVEAVHAAARLVAGVDQKRVSGRDSRNRQNGTRGVGKSS